MRVACHECSKIRRDLRRECDALRAALEDVDRLLAAAGCAPDAAARRRIALAVAIVRPPA
jgi:hypothetical protein